MNDLLWENIMIAIKMNPSIYKNFDFIYIFFETEGELINGKFGVFLLEA